MAYRWVVFIHVASAFGFFIIHGASINVAFRLRKEREPERIRGLLQLSSGTITLSYVFLGLLLAGGIVAGFMGEWWGQRWIWTALILLLLITGLMFPLGTLFYRKVSNVLSMATPSVREQVMAELDSLLSSPRPWILAVVGYGGLLVIMWLMMFKPF